MALTIPSKVTVPSDLTGTPPAPAAAAARAPVVATGGSERGRAAAATLTPPRSQPLAAALAAPAVALSAPVAPGAESPSDADEIRVVADVRDYSGWKTKGGSNAWMKAAATDEELVRMTEQGLTRLEFNTLLNNLYRPQPEQNLAARFNSSYHNASWPKMQAVMTPAERSKAAAGQMTPAEAHEILRRAEPEAGYRPAPPTFTPALAQPRPESRHYDD